MDDLYKGREQTAAKHVILRHYLQELALITLGGKDGGYQVLTYVDGFSGPWESRCADYSDTSFMIAVGVLKDVQRQLAARGGRPVIKCFFVEKKRSSFKQLDPAVCAHHDPASDFHVETFNGRFQDAIPDIMAFAEGFTLTFIDPTGWTEYGPRERRCSAASGRPVHSFQLKGRRTAPLRRGARRWRELGQRLLAEGRGLESNLLHPRVVPRNNQLGCSPRGYSVH